MNQQDKVVKGSKWDKMFLGEDLVALYIPQDPLNPNESIWLSINDVEIVLAVGQQLQVPASVADLWNHSHERTLAGESMMSKIMEIGV